MIKRSLSLLSSLIRAGVRTSPAGKGTRYAIAAALCAGSAGAQDNRTWNGGTDLDWTNAANWSTGVPDGNDLVNIAGSGGGSLTNVYSGNTDQYRLFFNSGAGTYTLNGPSTVTFYDFGGNAPKIENNSTNTQTINFGVVMDGAGTGGNAEINPVSGQLVFSSSVSLADTTVLNVWGANTATFQQGISAATFGSLILNQSTTTVLNGTSSFGAENNLANGSGNISIGANPAGSGSTLTINGTVTGVDQISLQKGTLNINSGATVNTVRFVSSDASGATNTINQSGGTFTISGSVNSGTSSSFLIGHWPAASVYNLSGGTVNAPNAPLNLGWDGQSTVNQTGGTANLQGINFNNGRNNTALYSLGTGGRLNIGSYGMNGNASAKEMRLAGGILGATANWTGSQNMTVTAASEMNTLDAVDGTTARTITISGGISGAGSLNKAGAGILSFTTQKTYTGNTTVNGGTLSLDGGGGSGGTIRGTVTVNSGATLRLNSGDVTGYGTGADRLATINVSGGTLNVNTTANQTLGNAVINLTGGSITGVASSNLDFFQTTSGLNTLASATTSTSSGVKLQIRQSAGLTINTAAGTTGSGIDFDVSSVISSNGSFASAPLIKDGAGTMRLSSASTYSGATQVNGGRLIVTGNLRSSPSFSVASGATLELNAVNIFVANHGTALADSRTITANGGTILMNTAFDARFGNVTLNNGATWTSNRTLAAYDAYLANVASGAATVSVTGTGTSTMNGTGGIHLGGTQNFNVADTTSSSADDLLVTMLLDNGGLGGGTGGVNKLGAGTMLLNGQNTYTGGSTVNAGTLAVDGNQQANRLTNNHAVTVNSGGAFEIRGVNALPTGGNAVDVTVNSGGTLRVVSGGSAGVGASGQSHAHIRNITLNGGTVDLTYSGAGTAYDGESFSLNGNVTVGGSTPSTITSTAATSVQGLHLNGTRTFTVADVTGSSAADLAISAELEGGGLTKEGAGTLSISSVSSYTGATTVNAGTLFLESTGSIANSTTTVNSGGKLAGTGTAGPVNIASGGTLSPGASPGTLTTGSITTTSGSTVEIEINGLTAGSLYDRIVTSGTIDLGNSTLVVALNFPGIAEGDSFDIWLNNDSGTDPITGTFNGLAEGSSIPAGMGSFTITYAANADGGTVGNDIRLTYVPEPASTAALAAAGLMLASRRRRNRGA